MNNNITNFVINTPFRTMTNEYTYGEDNLLTEFNINKERTVSYVYDDLNRLNDITISTTAPINIHYYYADSNRSGYSTTKIEEEIIDDTTYRYEYDAVGNITKISEVLSDDTAEPLYSYTYDKLNELTEVFDYTNLAKHTYTYNTAGNMTKEVITYYNSSVPVSSTTIKYAYSDSNWKDKLTNYNGQTITYDEIGNPLSYRDGMTMTWEHGRQLSSLQTEDNEVNYKYDSNGMRTQKSDSNGTTNYYYDSDKNLIGLTKGNDTLLFYYDSDGNVTSFSYNGTMYYYIKNLQGDIVKIIDYLGTEVANYVYDAWGNIQGETGEPNIRKLNPFRYRGYVYDEETGLYYLQSRYYDPLSGRFLNADDISFIGFTGTVLSGNLFCYCENNPITNTDPNGYFVLRRWMVASVIDIILYAIPVIGSAFTPIKLLAKTYGKSILKNKIKTPLYKFVKFIVGSAAKIIKSVRSFVKGIPFIGNWLSTKIKAIKLSQWLAGLLANNVLNKVINSLVNNIDILLSLGGMISGIWDFAYDKKLNNVLWRI